MTTKRVKRKSEKSILRLADQSDIRRGTPLSIKLHNPDLKEKLARYIARKGTSRAAVLNRVMEAVFNVETPFDEDIVENIEKMSGLINRIDWDDLKEIKGQLQNSPLTKRATLQDVAVAMMIRGIKSYKEKNI